MSTSSNGQAAEVSVEQIPRQHLADISKAHGLDIHNGPILLIPLSCRSAEMVLLASCSTDVTARVQHLGRSSNKNVQLVGE